MKVLFLLIILFVNTTFAQSAKLNGKIEYEMFLSFDKIQKYNSVLFFNDSISIFSYKNIDVNLEEHINTDNPNKIKSNTVIIDTTSYKVIIKKKENLIILYISLTFSTLKDNDRYSKSSMLRYSLIY